MWLALEDGFIYFIVTMGFMSISLCEIKGEYEAY
jgi:hypothetical protein